MEWDTENIRVSLSVDRHTDSKLGRYLNEWGVGLCVSVCVSISGRTHKQLAG